MQHYERAGEFAKTEDAFFAMLDAEPDNPAIVEFGIRFYERLRSQSDAALNAAVLIIWAARQRRPITFGRDALPRVPTFPSRAFSAG